MSNEQIYLVFHVVCIVALAPFMMHLVNKEKDHKVMMVLVVMFAAPVFVVMAIQQVVKKAC